MTNYTDTSPMRTIRDRTLMPAGHHDAGKSHRMDQATLCGSWPRAAATVSTVRVSMGGPPRGEGYDLGSTPARVITVTAGVARQLSRAPGLLARQLLQVRVGRAQTPLTGHVLPPPHDEGASQAAG